MPADRRDRQVERRQALSLETRRNIVRLVLDEGRSVADVARLLDRPDATLRSFLDRYNRTGELEPSARGGDRYHRLEQRHLDFLADELEQSVPTTVDALNQSLCAHFANDFANKPLADTTVCRALNTTLKFRLKVPHVEPADYNTEDRVKARNAWCARFRANGTRWQDCVFVDEGVFKLHTTKTNGRAAMGDRTVDITPTLTGGYITLMAALTSGGVVAPRAHRARLDAASFVSWLDDELFPALREPRIIILDNAKIHHSAETEECIQRHANEGHRIVFLPSYSPYLNAIEWLFGYIKPRIARDNLGGTASLFEALSNSLLGVTPAMACRWIDNVHANALRAIEHLPLNRQYAQGGLDFGRDMAEGEDDGFPPLFAPLPLT